MYSPATSTYLPPLEVNHEREGVGEELQTTLHELVALYEQMAAHRVDLPVGTQPVKTQGSNNPN